LSYKTKLLKYILVKLKNKLTNLVTGFWIKIKNLRIFSFLQKSKPSNNLDYQKYLDEKLIQKLSKSKIPNIKQFKLLSLVLNKNEKLLLKILSTTAALAVIGLLINLYFQNTVTVPRPGGKYIEGLVGVPKYINPLLSQYNDVDQDISTLLFNGLMKVNSQGVLELDLAREYQVSEDQKSYTFYLKDNIYWHDGEKLTPDDVIFTFSAIMDPEWQSLWRTYFNNVTIEKIDDLTLRFNLEEPSSLFLENTTFGIIPEHLWQNIPAANVTLAELNKKPVGTGPYQFKNLTKDKNGNIRSFTVERNNNYYNRPPYIEEITFKFYGDFETATEALSNNNIEGLSLLPKEKTSELEKNNELAFYNLSLPQYTAVFFNTKSVDYLTDKNIRQALSYAIDKQRILKEAVEQKGQLIYGPILPGFVGYNPNLKKYTFDQSEAIGLLKDGGWELIPDEESGQLIRSKDGQKLSITLTTVDKIEYTKTAEIIQENWQTIGIEVNVDIVAKNKIINDVIDPRNYQALIFGEIIKNDPYPFWHSSQTQNPGTNLAVWSNREIDNLLEAGRLTTDIKTKDQKYKDFQAILVEESPVIFLYNPVHLYPVNKKIKGINTLRINSPSDRFLNITDWYIKIKREFE